MSCLVLLCQFNWHSCHYLNVFYVPIIHKQSGGFAQRMAKEAAPPELGPESEKNPQSQKASFPVLPIVFQEEARKSKE
jgi:hypothetical protein